MEKETITITAEEKEMFDYLNELRDSGETNMFGAGIYVSTQFGVDKKEASGVVTKWMANFNAEGYEDLVE